MFWEPAEATCLNGRIFVEISEGKRYVFLPLKIHIFESSSGFNPLVELELEHDAIPESKCS